LNKQKGKELRQLSDAIANNANQPDWLRDFAATMFLQAMRLTLVGFNSGTTSTQFILDQADTLVTRSSTYHHLDNDDHLSTEKMTIVATAGDDGSEGIIVMTRQVAIGKGMTSALATSYVWLWI